MKRKEKSGKELINELDNAGVWLIFEDDDVDAQKLRSAFSKRDVERLTREVTRIFDKYDSDMQKNKQEWDREQMLA